MSPRSAFYARPEAFAAIPLGNFCALLLVVLTDVTLSEDVDANHTRVAHNQATAARVSNQRGVFRAVVTS